MIWEGFCCCCLCLPAVSIGDEAAAKAADHSADGEYCHGNGEDERRPLIGQCRFVSYQIRPADEILNHLSNSNSSEIIKFHQVLANYC